MVVRKFARLWTKLRNFTDGAVYRPCRAYSSCSNLALGSSQQLAVLVRGSKLSRMGLRTFTQ